MFPYMSAVMPQIAYAHSVRDFIRELLRRFIPGRWIDRAISGQDVTFDEKLVAAFSGLDETTASEKDYCAKVVSVLCDEVSSICEVTRLVCINRGYEEYADTYLSTEKFVRLLLRRDTAKLKRLNAALADKTKPLCVLIRDVGAVLEDKSADEIAALGAAEKRRANAELKAIAADVKKTMQTGFAEVKSGIADVGAKVDAVAKKVTKLRRSGKPRGRYSPEAKTICWNYWDTATNHEEVWRQVNTRVTYEAVFAHYAVQLARIGVESAKVYKKIVHAEAVRRNRGLQAKQDEAQRKSAAKANTERGKNGIIHAMKPHAKSALSLALAIVGGMAAGMRCDASEWVENSSQTNPRVAAYTVKTYTEGSDPFDAGNIGPQAVVPEEVVTVPASFVIGSGIGGIAGGVIGSISGVTVAEKVYDWAFTPGECDQYVICGEE